MPPDKNDLPLPALGNVIDLIAEYEGRLEALYVIRKALSREGEKRRAVAEILAESVRREAEGRTNA